VRRAPARSLRVAAVVSGLLLPWACGGDDSGGSGKKPSADASLDVTDGSNADGTLDSPGDASDGSADGASDGGGGTAGDAGEGGIPIDAQAATYDLELGGQVDALLQSQHPSDPSISYVLAKPPAKGELLHFGTDTGRFVYTSLVEGSDSFDFSIAKDGSVVDTATVSLTTSALDFSGDWNLHPLTSACSDSQFAVANADGGIAISPLVTACLKKASGMNSLPLGGTTTYNPEAQALGVVSCVNDIANVNYCYAFRYWRITSRGHFQSIETVSGTKTIGGVGYQIVGSVRGTARRVADTQSRAALSGLNTAIVQVGTSNGSPKDVTLTLENKGTLPAKIGTFVLPTEVTIPGGYPGTGGTCGPTLDAGKTCTVALVVTPTKPASGTVGSVPLSIPFSDDVGFDVTRLSVNWTFQ